MTEYQKYQLRWMIDHNFSISDLIRALNEYRIDCDPSDDLPEMFWQWEMDVGFGGEIWACEAEWKDCERILAGEIKEE